MQYDIIFYGIIFYNQKSIKGRAPLSSFSLTFSLMSVKHTETGLRSLVNIFSRDPSQSHPLLKLLYRIVTQDGRSCEQW